MKKGRIKSHKQVRLLYGRKSKTSQKREEQLRIFSTKQWSQKAPLARLLILVITKSLALYTMAWVNSPLLVPTRSRLPGFDSGEVHDIMWRLFVRLF
jgi:hypothetical protein